MFLQFSNAEKNYTPHPFPAAKQHAARDFTGEFMKRHQLSLGAQEKPSAPDQWAVIKFR